MRGSNDLFPAKTYVPKKEINHVLGVNLKNQVSITFKSQSNLTQFRLIDQF